MLGLFVCAVVLVRCWSCVRVVVVRSGVFVSLREFFDSGNSVRSLEVAVEFLKNLACDERVCVKAVFRLRCNAKARKELGELGCIGPLIGMLDGKAVKEKQADVKALSVILVCSGNRKIYQKEERGIVSIVQLLDPSKPNFDKKYHVSILMSLSHSKKCHKQMVNSGALLFLQKLVEMEVEGAKKLQESIGRAKLWGVFG
ncbi:vacuolar protein 8 [Tanacetum coccineum]